jgi:aldose 1-epimerase
MSAGVPLSTEQTAPRVFNLADGQGTSIAVSDLGATWLSCRVPLADGTQREVLLGRPTPAEHVSQGGYVGAVVGRYANRIAGARFVLDGVEYRLAANEGANQLHGGPEGFHSRTWQLLEQGQRHLLLGLHSPDGDQGFPGALQARVRYAIEGPGRIAIDFEAEVDRPCPVNLTSHAYFNLDGDADPAHTIAGHQIAIAASHWLPVDEALIPTGEIAPAAGTAMDLRTARPVGSQRFDHCYVLDAGAPAAASVVSGDGLLRMQLVTDAPGLQFYGGHFLPGSSDRLGRPYASGAGFAMEPQYWPDSPNRPEWPDHGAVLIPPAVLRRHMGLHFAPT